MEGLLVNVNDSEFGSSWVKRRILSLIEEGSPTCLARAGETDVDFDKFDQWIKKLDEAFGQSTAICRGPDLGVVLWREVLDKGSARQSCVVIESVKDDGMVNIYVFGDVPDVAEKILDKALEGFPRQTTPAERSDLVPFAIWRSDAHAEARCDWKDIECPVFSEIAGNYPQAKEVANLIGLDAPDRSGKIVIWTGEPGTGKCLGLGTPVLMADGTVKPVERIVAGDRLMGPSGEARTVLSTTTGRGPLFRIDPIKGEPWVCNDVHVLTLVHSGSGDIVDIGLDEWVSSGSTFKHRHKLFSVGVEAFEHEPPIPTVDPYFLGVWFGDGTKEISELADGRKVLAKVQVSKPDPEIRKLCEDMAATWRLKMRTYGEPTCPSHSLVGNLNQDDNRLLHEMRKLVGPDVTVPTAIVRGSRATRLQFLAGFVDSDGDLSCNCFFISQKREDWARVVWWIARSLGFCATIKPRRARDQNGTEGTYHVVSISGDVDQIPTRIPRRRAKPRQQKKVATRTGFTVTSIGHGDYYGFTLDGDGRFLLGDFTATHNTTAIRALAREWSTAKDATVEVVVDPEKLFGSADYLHQIFMGRHAGPRIAARKQRRLGCRTGQSMPRLASGPDVHQLRLVILEDCADFFAFDCREKAGFARFLNLTDGIIGQGLRIIFLLSANEKIEKFDPAVTRPGRCIQVMNFPLFGEAEAKAWVEAKGRPDLARRIVGHDWSLARLYQILSADRGPRGPLTREGDSDLKVGF
jgi:hypothetical protein